MSRVDAPHEHNFHPRYRPDIDGLRALAILMVVAYHAFPDYALGGFIGVDVFFVISGYLISLIIFKSLSDAAFDFTEFYAHRIKRILPALVVVVGACYAFGWFALLPDEFKQLGKHITASMGFVQNFVLWNEAGYFDAASEAKPLMHLWSLAVEEQFYLVYPALIWLAWRGGRAYLFASVLALGVVSFSFSAIGASRDPVGAFFLPQARFWELMAGSLLAYLREFSGWRHTLLPRLHRVLFNGVIVRELATDAARNALLAQAASTLGLLLIAYAFIALDRSVHYPGALVLLPVGGAFLLILAGPHAWVNRHLLAARAMIGIGLISYPLYLWHWPLLSFAYVMESEAPPVGMRAALVVLAFVLATLTYRFVERPVRYGSPTVRKVMALSLSAAVVACIGFGTYQLDGLALRIPETVRLNASLVASRRSALPDEDLTRCKQAFRAPGDRRECWVAKDAAPTVQLIGDSHAAALYSGLREALAETDDNLFFYGGRGGCPPLFNVVSFQRKMQEAERLLCTEQTNRALDIAETNANIRAVILVSRGPLYLSGRGFYHDKTFADEADHDRALESMDRPGLTDHYQIWEAGMRRTLSGLVEHGKRVVFVLDNPELGFYPSSCIDARPLRFATRVRQPCAVSRAEVDARNRRYRELVASVLRDYPSVTVFDAAAPLCDEQWCWGMKDGQVLYRDDDHLSLAGSRMMASRLVPLLDGKPASAPRSGPVGDHAQQ